MMTTYSDSFWVAIRNVPQQQQHQNERGKWQKESNNEQKKTLCFAYSRCGWIKCEYFLLSELVVVAVVVTVQAARSRVETLLAVY